ncbi:aminopeptidase [Radiomyces spectabilis]|uniref:aminopeptidase n=1 Tax=Radiomyces spectabilis TaxID=64574 RepID=UPI0022204B9D|nr:aminopeptidase [Radiomyces spectabilis]KAI8393668.1 aminopeptidase [Radiomyces spectabilis]
MDRQVLPTNVKPTHYDLTLSPDLQAFVFQGRVKVDLDVVEPTTSLTLNAQDINIQSASLYKDQNSQNATNITYNSDKHEATLTFADTIPASAKVTLDLVFDGVLNDQMAGFYRSSYKDANGTTQYLATTQFEATDARRAFPCWDEPSLKATFDITLIVPSDLTALSNMEVASEAPFDDHRKQVKYATTPRMSTYLVAFIVGPFEYIEAYTTGEFNNHPIRTRVYALPGSVEQGRHALNVSIHALEYYAQIFGEPYPLRKMDLVAIPDFEAGAMENWGLVTFRTSSLLYDEHASSLDTKKDTAYTVSHELAHQWFGNLVTMAWWDHLWLNEGFATWVGWLAVDKLFPEWNVWTSFVVEDMQKGLQLDALRSSHPIEVVVNDPSEIHQIFDSISYSKGASVIRMLSSWLGVDTFLAGVRRYVQLHKYDNASTDDLWAALGEVAGVNVSAVMTMWTAQVGFPVLIVGDGAKRDNVRLSQRRYLLNGVPTPEEDTTTWSIPLNVQVANGDMVSRLFNEKSGYLDIPSTSLFKLNSGQTGFYRTAYPSEMISLFVDDLSKGSNGVLLTDARDRAGLLADAGNLCVSGEQSTTVFLDLANALASESDPFVWQELSVHLNNIIATWSDEPDEVKNQLQSFRRRLFAAVADKVGWDYSPQDGYSQIILRTLAISMAGRSGDPKAVAQAREKLAKAVEEHDWAILNANIFSSILNTVLLAADTGEEETRVWEIIHNIYLNESLPSDQRKETLKILGKAKSRTLQQRYLNMAFDENQIRPQDTAYVFTALGGNPYGRDYLWEYFTTNYDQLHTRFAQSMSLFSNLVKATVSSFTSLEKLNEAEAFFANKDTREYDRALRQTLESSKGKAQWLIRDRDQVAAWLKDHASTSTSIKEPNK